MSGVSFSIKVRAAHKTLTSFLTVVFQAVLRLSTQEAQFE